MADLKSTIASATKDAMRRRQRERVRALRLVNAAIKQAEIDGRCELADADVLVVLNKMRKQRRDSVEQFANAGRDDRAAIERFEIALIEEFLPANLAAAEIEEAVRAAIAATGAVSMKDMGKVMRTLTSQLAGRADMAAVSRMVRSMLA